MTLNNLRPGQAGTVLALRLEGAARRRLRDLGLVEGARVRCLGSSPLGDPSAYGICGAAIALRRSDSRRIEVEVEPWSG